MNRLFILFAFCSASLFAQTNNTSGTKNKTFSYSEKQNTIDFSLPENAEYKSNGKFTLNGKDYHIEIVNANEYLKKATTRLDTVPDKNGRDILILSHLFPERAMNLNQLERIGTITDNQMRVSDDKEVMACWYTYKDADKTMTTNLEGGKVVGDNIFIVVMDDKVAAKSIELKKQRTLIFEILDSAIAQLNKKAK